MSLPIFFGIFYFIILTIINTTGGYGIFVDEYYYLACSKRLSWGYVDQPPFSIFLLSLFRIDGNSILFLRFIPAVFAGFPFSLSGILRRDFRVRGLRLFYLVLQQ